MPNGKRASMREGPLAALFRKTAEDTKSPAEQAPAQSPRRPSSPRQRSSRHPSSPQRALPAPAEPTCRPSRAARARR